jgi:hypothetical protein
MASNGALQEVTELAAHQASARTLILQAFAERLGDVHVDTMFHRNWNGGWRCRATIAGRGTLEFALLLTANHALLPLPVPMPAGWKVRGVMAADGTRWSSNDNGTVTPVAAA